MQELISIIIPVYGVEKYLDKCIQSVVQQTYKELEIILVDDGSRDNSPKICDEWKKKDDRIVVIHKRNGGLSDARNTGLAIAKGTYISFIDSDDYIEKDMIETMYDAMKKNESDLVICDFAMVTETGKRFDVEGRLQGEIITGIEGLERLINTGNWRYVTAVNKLYSTNILKGIKFPVGKIHEDEFVVHKVFFQCNKIVILNQELYNYVQSEGSITRGTKGIKSLDIVEAFCDRIWFCYDKDLKQYIPRLLSLLKYLYNRERILLSKMRFVTERKRIREIDELFKETYFKFSTPTLREKIMFSFPAVWFFYVREKKKIKKFIYRKS